MNLKSEFMNKDILSLFISIINGFMMVRYSSLNVYSHGEHVLDAFVAFFFMIGFYISIKKLVHFIF